MGLALLIGSLLVFIGLKMPIGLALAVSSTLYLVFSDRNFSLTIIPERMIDGLDSYPFLAVPFFIMAARFMNSAGITHRIFDFALSLVGHIKGGLGHVNIVASMIFSGMSGAAVADTAGLGLIEIKAMIKEGYSRAMAAAITAASAIIGPIIPPSITLVIYGVLAEVSVGRLFLAGLLPGLVMGFALMCMVYFLAASGREVMPTRPRQSLCEIWVSFKKAFFTLLAPLILLGGIAGGVVTPTEAGVIAVIYAIILGILYREIIFRHLPGILGETAEQTAAVMFLLAGATIFGWILTVERVPMTVTVFMLGLTDNPYIILLLINVLLLGLGMFLNSSTILVLTIPVFKPMIMALGIDPVHFGIIMTLNVMIGMLTPPLGVCLYIAADIAEAPFEKVFKAVIPFYIPLIVCLLLVTYFPGWVLFLPNLFLG